MLVSEGQLFEFSNVSTGETRQYVVVDEQTRLRELTADPVREGSSYRVNPVSEGSSPVHVLERLDGDPGRYAMVSEKWLLEGRLSGASASWWRRMEAAAA